MLVLKQRIPARRWFVGLFLALAMCGALSLTGSEVSARHDVATPGCPLVIGSVTGDTANFTATNPTGSAISLTIPANTVGVWGTITLGASANANVVVGTIPVGTKDEVLVTATKIDPNLPASFSLTAMDSVGHNVTVNATVECTPVQGCTRTQGFWKNKPEEWPVNSLSLGNTTYTKAQLISILKTPTKGNGLVSLSHQLIAAKLNAAAGTSVPASVAAAISQADAMIGNLVVPPVGSGSLSTASTSATAAVLDDYNNGNTPGGPAHCD